jgi:hypothetical protein
LVAAEITDAQSLALQRVSIAARNLQKTLRLEQAHVRAAAIPEGNAEEYIFPAAQFFQLRRMEL